MKILIAVILFSIIILFHEFGHFLMARACGVEVVEFSLGMGPRLLSHVSGRSGTRYSVKCLPFGGSCQMKGEDGEDSTEGSFGEKKVWQRLLIVAAGPLFNFLLAFLFSIVIISSVGYDAPVIEYLAEDYPMAQAGMKPGDIMTSMGGEKILVYRDISNYLTFHEDELTDRHPVTITWLSNGERRSAEVTPKLNENGTRYIFGIYGGMRYSAGADVGKILKYSLYEVGFWIDTVEESRSDGAFYVFLNLLNLGILLSANLGVMNLIPFPALDGGRILLLLIEAVRRRKLSGNVEAYINLAGFAVLMCLMVVILFNDIRKLF